MRDYSNTGLLVPGSPEHMRTITASKVPVILGLSEWESPAQLWLRMRGDIPPQDVNDAMRRGHNQEDSILRWFFEVMHPEFEWVSGETTITRGDLPWAAANPDSIGQVFTPEDDPFIEHPIFVEAKSVARDMGKWGKPGTDQVPMGYYAQCQWQMHMSHGHGGQRVQTTYLIKHGPFVDQWDEYIIKYNPVLAQQIEQIAHRFWLSLEDDDACPAPSTTRGEAAAFAKLHPEIERELEWQINPEHAAAFHDARNRVKAAELEVEQAKAMILRSMGNARVAKVGDLTVARRQPTKKGVSLYPPQRDIEVHEIHQAATSGKEAA